VRNRFALAVIASLLTSTTGHTLQSQDSQQWVGDAEDEAVQPRLRWQFNTGSSDFSVIFDEPTDQTTQIASISGQVDYYPFGDEFYLSAGAISAVDDSLDQRWSQIASDPAWAAFPHAQLTAQSVDANNIEDLTRYVGAGLVVRDLNNWSLTVEGGAYFRDKGEHRMTVTDLMSNNQVMLLDNLDTVDREAVGASQARSVRPVGHLVIRRRF
jgi:hypothetical protein